MGWIDTLNQIGLTGFIFTIASFLIYRYFKKKDNKEVKEDSTAKELSVMKENFKQLDEELQKVTKNYDEEISKINLLINNLLEAEIALLREKIIKIYNHYYNEKHYFPIYARESLEHMYNAYKKMGGNGVIDDLVADLYSLPTEVSD